MTDPFLDDGCTGFLDGWGGLSWRICCDVHDTQFLTGTSWTEFWQANFEFHRCVAQYDIFAATLMFLAVSTVGALFFWLGRKVPKKPTT